MDEKRNFQRVPFTAGAEIKHHGINYQGELSDISLQGASISGNETIPLPAGSCCELAISLLNPRITLRFETAVIHRRQNRLGVKFITEDIETAIHLRRLLEFNIGSSAAVEKEVAKLLNIS